jgi:hypothetical protein
MLFQFFHYRIQAIMIKKNTKDIILQTVLLRSGWDRIYAHNLFFTIYLITCNC